MPKQVYLHDSDAPKTKRNVAIGVILMLFSALGFAFFLKTHQPDVKIPDKEEACQLLMIAFDEAQLAPGWYESAGQVLKTCNLNITDDDILGKTCSANRWNGYESDRCTEFEKSRQ